jgi:hypothetical protein
LLWLYDVAGTEHYNITVTLTYADTTTEVVYTNTSVSGGILKIKFNSALV